jgi:hypothetical protein
MSCESKGNVERPTAGDLLKFNSCGRPPGCVYQFYVEEHHETNLTPRRLVKGGTATSGALTGAGFPRMGHGMGTNRLVET